MGCGRLNPALELTASPIFEWATAVWAGLPSRDLLRMALSDARKTLVDKNGYCPWTRATTAAHGFLLSLERLGWEALAARRLRTHLGTDLALMLLPPAAIRRLVDEATVAWVALGGGVADSISWAPLRRLGHGIRPTAWSARQWQAFIRHVAGTPWPGLRL